jgi:hypothetical protein
MKHKPAGIRFFSRIGICCALVMPGLALDGAAAPPNTNSAKAKAAAEDEALVEAPESVFNIPSTSREGRDPFFPQSTRGLPVIPKSVKPVHVDISNAIILNGLAPSGAKRTAMINGRTFEIGEEADVRLPDGTKVHIKCEDIKEDSATVKVNGQTRELRLRRGV